MRHDVLVLGAGPAGSTLARRIAAAGARVALIGAPHRAGLEGVSERGRALLAEEGIESGAEFLQKPCIRRGRWADRLVEGREWLVDRVQLAQALLKSAVRAGAEARAGTATRVSREEGAWRVSTRDGETLTAPVLVEARGRRGAARRGPLLLAYGRRFLRRRTGAGGTRIEPADFGWCWWAEHGDTLWVQVVASPRSGHPAGWIEKAARQIPSLEQALRDVIAQGAPSACSAHARLGMDGRGAAGEPRARPWRVGDAAVAIDPLAGQGIYQALRSARLVATAIRAVMNGSDAALAERFVMHRHEEDFERGAGAAAEFYGQNRGRGEFWAQTATRYEALSGSRGRLLTATRVERRPVLIDDRIVERDVLVSGAHPRGVWQVSGVPIVELMRHLSANAGATPQSAAHCLGRPGAAVTAAMHWLDQAEHRGG